MSDGKIEVTLVGPAKVDGKRRPAGWTGMVSEIEHGHLRQAGVLAGELPAEAKSRSLITDFADSYVREKKRAVDLQAQLDRVNADLEAEKAEHAKTVVDLSRHQDELLKSGSDLAVANKALADANKGIADRDARINTLEGQLAEAKAKAPPSEK